LLLFKINGILSFSDQLRALKHKSNGLQKDRPPLIFKNCRSCNCTLGITGKLSMASTAMAGISNPIPRWRGFNLLDYFSPMPPKGKSSAATTEDDFRWMSDWGFDFVRIPKVNSPIPISI